MTLKLKTDGNLYQALSKAQAEFDIAQTSGYNPHFKNTFSTQTDLIKASRPALSKYGLAVVQYPQSENDKVFLVTKIIHESGEAEYSTVQISLDKPNDPQAFGKALSYYTRYVYKNMVGVMSADESEDDDAQSISATPQNNGCISEKQLALLKMLLKDQPQREAPLCSKYRIDTLAQLPWKHMDEVVAVLKQKVT